jgi:hypothetical protein
MKNPKLATKRLSLNKEALRELTGTDLKQVAGGWLTQGCGNNSNNTCVGGLCKLQ